MELDKSGDVKYKTEKIALLGRRLRCRSQRIYCSRLFVKILPIRVADVLCTRVGLSIALSGTLRIFG